MYIACEDMDFVWKEHQVVLFEEMWNRGMHIKDIAKMLRRPVDEVFILALDRARAGAIAKREGGIFGHSSSGYRTRDRRLGDTREKIETGS
jgi:hypothetical protein